VSEPRQSATRAVASIYNKATYEPEKKAAFDRWAAHLLAVVEGRKRRNPAISASATV
jgi:hypothetical protein